VHDLRTSNTVISSASGTQSDTPLLLVPSVRVRPKPGRRYKGGPTFQVRAIFFPKELNRLESLAHDLDYLYGGDSWRTLAESPPCTTREYGTSPARQLDLQRPSLFRTLCLSAVAALGTWHG
jgi:hypothetical protein